MKHREKRVAESLKAALSDVLLRMDFFSSTVFTIMDVTVTKDLRQARIFYTVPEQDREKIHKKLTDNCKHIRHEVAGKIRLRYMPELEFALDPTIDKVNKVMEIFAKIENEEKQ